MFPSRHRLLTVSVVLVFLLPAPGVHPQAPNPCFTMANGRQSDGRYACADCSTSAATSNRGPTFEYNLLRFRDSLKDMATGNASFLNATFAGDAPEDTDTVYGLATCLADAEASDCATCLAAAAGELPGTRCGNRRDMVLWYPQCLVRYDNATFFGVADTSPGSWFYVPNANNFSDPSSLDAAREMLNGRMLTAAAESQLRFAFDHERLTASTTLHGLAQCTEDLTLDECARCLKSNVDRVAECCADLEGVRINGASCYLRYEFMPIVPDTPPSMAPLVGPSPPEAPSGGAVAVSSSRTRKKTTIYIIAAALGSVALLCFLVAGGFWLWKKRRRGKRMESSLLQLQHHYPRRYSYAQVKRMTSSFADKLGQGGNGTVYKGRLPEPDGREVAVKMLKEQANNKVDGEEFVNEVASISRTSHVNVVALLGFCLDGSSNKRGLVYEYMPNGSLERYAVGDDGGGGGRWCLRWEQLFDVAVGIARGLEYLHRGCSAHIVHFDIKPHNILLDAQLRPKISDFGLAKLCPQKESTIAVSIAGARGTAGYIAPEVFSRHAGAAVTSKSDVYSYGMMLLEMVGATRNTGSDGVSSGTGTGTTSTATATRYFPEWLYQDLDRFCAQAGEEEVVRKLVIAGLWCIRLSPQDRPTMSRVVEMLEKTTTADLQLPPGP